MGSLYSFRAVYLLNCLSLVFNKEPVTEEDATHCMTIVELFLIVNDAASDFRAVAAHSAILSRTVNLMSSLILIIDSCEY